MVVRYLIDFRECADLGKIRISSGNQFIAFFPPKHDVKLLGSVSSVFCVPTPRSTAAVDTFRLLITTIRVPKSMCIAKRKL